MKNHRLMKRIIMGMATIALGFSLAGATSAGATSISNPNPTDDATDILEPTNPVLQDMSKYATTSRDEQDNSLVVHVSSQQFLLYLKDNGMKDEDIPVLLRSKKIFEVVKLTFDKNSADQGVKVCLSGEGNRLCQDELLKDHFQSLLSGLYITYYLQV